MNYKVSPSVELPLREAYPFGEAHGLAREVHNIRRSSTPPGVHQSVYRRALIVALFAQRNLLQKFIEVCWPYGSTADGQELIAAYHRRLLHEGSTPSDHPSEVGSLEARHSSRPLSGDSAGTRLLAFVRGMAIFRNRRVTKAEQEALLRRNLANVVEIFGVFDKSGNYALASEDSPTSVRNAVGRALRQHERLRDLSDSEVTVLAADEVERILGSLLDELSQDYGSAFDRRTYGLQLDESVWRAGLAFLPEPHDLARFPWPSGGPIKVIVLESSGSVARFLKREEQPNEDRITFGDPTRALDLALGEQLGRPITSTSRSARTVRGVLRKFIEQS